MDMYLSLMEDTEPPYIYHRWSFLSAVAATLGRDFFLPFGEEIIYPNMYVVLIGPPAARKSTAIKLMYQLLVDSGYEFFAGDKSSKEKFLADWEHGFDKIWRGVEPGNLEVGNADGMEALFSTTDLKSRTSEAYIKAGELQDFLGGGNATFISMLTNLWDNLPHYSDRFKNSKSIYIPNPTINLIGGATSTSFAAIFSSDIIGQGMFSRLILVNGKKQRKKLTIPPPLNAEKKLEVVQLLRSLKTYMKGPATLTPDAYAALDEIYQNPREMVDSRLMTYAGRRLTHLLKLCLVIAATECTKNITKEIVLLANTVLTYTELYMPNALGEFGKAKNAEVSQTVLDVIAEGEQSGGLTAEGILVKVGQNVESVHALQAILQKLMASHKIEMKEIRGQRVIVPMRKKMGRDTTVNFDLLWEYQVREGE